MAELKILARLPLLHPEGLHREATLGPGEALKRAVKVRSGLVHRRTTSMARLDALLEILGPAWVAAIGSDMSLTALRLLARYGHPEKVKRAQPTGSTSPACPTASAAPRSIGHAGQRAHQARAGRYDLLLVYRRRSARPVRARLAQILEGLDTAVSAFRSATEPFDTPAGRMMVQMLGVFAEFERATIIDPVIAGMERKAAKGGWSGRVPTGYRLDRDRAPRAVGIGTRL